MRQLSAHVVMVAAAILVGQTPVVTADPTSPGELVVYEGAGAPEVRAALVAAVRLLPRPPVRIAVIDADDAEPDVRSVLLRIDAFVFNASPVVYVVRQSPLLQLAVDGSTLHRHALAAVIWHEMAHVEGADERKARHQEEVLWMSFIRDQRVDGVAGLRYLKSLVERPGDLLMAAR